MSDGEAERMTDPAPQWSTRRGPFGRVVHSFLELLYDSVHDEWGCRLDQVREGHWFLGSMMVVACLSRTAGCAAYGQSVNVISTWESPEMARFDRLQPSISGPPVTLQSTHEAALEVVDLADLKRRALELT